MLTLAAGRAGLVAAARRRPGRQLLGGGLQEASHHLVCKRHLAAAGEGGESVFKTTLKHHPLWNEIWMEGSEPFISLSLREGRQAGGRRSSAGNTCSNRRLLFLAAVLHATRFFHSNF